MLETTKFNPYGDKGYKMKNNYSADKLIVANFERISSEATMYGPMVETTEQKYYAKSPKFLRHPKKTAFQKVLRCHLFQKDNCATL